MAGMTVGARGGGWASVRSSSRQTERMPTEPALGIGDLVVVAGRARDVWEIVAVRHGIARIAARSIHLEGGRSRSVALDQLTRYDRESLEGDAD